MVDEPNNTQLFVQMYLTLTKTIIQNHFFEEFGLSRLQAITLANVYQHSGISMSDLADLIGTTRPQITRIVDNLEKQGLVKRQKNATNHRIYNVLRTEKGIQVAQQHLAFVENQIGIHLDQLSLTERQELNTDLANSIKLLTKAGVIKADLNNDPA